MRKINTTAGKRYYRWDYQEFLYLIHTFRQSKDFRRLLNLFLDLLTQREISEIIRRLMIASMLREKKTYAEIQEVVGTCSNTISRVHKKFFRQKSVLAQILGEAGSFGEFYKKRNEIDTRDWLSKMIDKTIYNRAGRLSKK